VVATVLPVAAGLNDPQVPVGIQLQVTPLFAKSLFTTAVSCAFAPATKVVGNAGVKVTEMAWFLPQPLLPITVMPITKVKRGNIPKLRMNLIFVSSQAAHQSR